MLCLKTVNNGGVLTRQIGEMIIPYDIDKIQRDCKWFSIDTVRVALELYKKLGLVYENNDGVLAISDFDRLIGSQTYGAEKKALQRQNKENNFLQGGQKADICPPDKDKEKDKDKYIYKDKDTDKASLKENIEKKKRKPKVFVPPSFEEVAVYAKKKGREDLSSEFFEYFSEGDWIDSKGNPVLNWKQKFLTWCGRNEKKTPQTQERYGEFSVDDAFIKAMERSYGKKE